MGIMLKLELITNLQDLERLENEWNSLLPHNATNEIFLTFQWQSTWWTVYQPGDLWVIVARDGERLVGIAPWFLEAGTRIVRTIGCVDVTDYLDVLVVPDYREAFFTEIIGFLCDHAADYSKIDLCNTPGGSSILEFMPRLLSERGFSVQVKHEDVCPIIRLPGDFEAYLNQLDKKQRHEIRRKLRRVEGEGERVAWYVVGMDRDLDAEIEKFLNLMRASHPEKAKFLQNSKNEAFFRAIMPRLAACGWLQLIFLTVDGNPAAAYLNFDYNNNILVYNSGLMPDEYAYLSPGIVLLTYMIQHAIAEGKQVFDFLQGNEEYKYRMGAHEDREVLMLEATRAG
jgi:CelD/BcsL family acetyltransferase involved in cellulose biosynthesis